MKSNLYVEHLGSQIEDKELITKVKEIWVSGGKKIKDLKTLSLYVKAADNAVYYVINDDVTGQFELI